MGRFYTSHDDSAARLLMRAAITDRANGLTLTRQRRAMQKWVSNTWPTITLATARGGPRITAIALCRQTVATIAIVATSPNAAKVVVTPGKTP